MGKREKCAVHALGRPTSRRTNSISAELTCNTFLCRKTKADCFASQGPGYESWIPRSNGDWGEKRERDVISTFFFQNNIRRNSSNLLGPKNKVWHWKVENFQRDEKKKKRVCSIPGGVVPCIIQRWDLFPGRIQVTLGEK